jgi:hypothetical protein
MARIASGSWILFSVELEPTYIFHVLQHSTYVRVGCPNSEHVLARYSDRLDDALCDFLFAPFQLSMVL